MNGTTSDMTRSAARHFSGITLNATLVAALVAIALAALAMVIGFSSVFSSAFAGSIDDDQPGEVLDQLVTEHQASIRQYQERFKQRYVFFKPPPPPPPPTPPQRQPEPVVHTPPPEPGPPDTYPGPSVAWVIGDEVYFHSAPSPTEKYLRVKVGQERSGVKVINLDNMPRSVRVGHSGGEYDVKVFGESTLTSSLFPQAPRPSILTPGLIPAEAPVAAAADGGDDDGDGAEDEGDADAQAAQAAMSGEANVVATPGAETPRRGSPRGDGPRGEGRRRPRDAAGERPPRPVEQPDQPGEGDDSDDTEEDEEGDGEEDDPQGR